MAVLQNLAAMIEALQLLDLHEHSIETRAIRFACNTLARAIRAECRRQTGFIPRSLSRFCVRCGALDDLAPSDIGYMCPVCAQKMADGGVKTMMGYVYILDAKGQRIGKVETLKGVRWLDIVASYSGVARKLGFILWRREAADGGHYEDGNGRRIYLSRGKIK